MSSIIPQHEIIKIPHSKLVRNPNNRSVKRSDLNVKRRAADIKALGILQNIVVTPAPDKKGFYRLEAGTGRYESVELLIQSGDATPEFLYPALVANDENLSALIKLAENSNRDDLHPVDQYTAYADAQKAGMDIKEIANGNGVTVKHVKQRLLLASLSPELLDALRANKISVEVAEVFTLLPDHERQNNLFKSLSTWQRDSAWSVKQLLLDEKITESHSLAKLVGKQAYKKAGGHLVASLFDETAIFENPEILFSVAESMLQRAASELSGWKWVEVTTEGPTETETYRKTERFNPIGSDIPESIKTELARLETEVDELEKIEDLDQASEKRLDEAYDRIECIREMETNFEVYSEEQMQVSGCILGVTDEGQIKILKGRIKAEDKKGSPSKATSNESEIESTEQDNEFSNSLLTSLGLTRTALLQSMLCEKPELAFDLGVFAIADPIFRGNTTGWCSSPAAISASFLSLNEADPSCIEIVESAQKKLNLTWANGDHAKRFEQFCALSASEKQQIFCYCTARSIHAPLVKGKHYNEVIRNVTKKINPDFRQNWMPGKEMFFKRINCAQLLEIGQEIFCGNFSETNKNLPKKALVELVYSAFTGEENTPEAVKKRARKWLPKGFK